MVVTWANNWNGVNHPATAPVVFSDPTGGDTQTDLPLADYTQDAAFESPQAELRSIGGWWESAR